MSLRKRERESESERVREGGEGPCVGVRVGASE